MLQTFDTIASWWKDGHWLKIANLSKEEDPIFLARKSAQVLPSLRTCWIQIFHYIEDKRIILWPEERKYDRNSLQGKSCPQQTWS